MKYLKLKNSITYGVLLGGAALMTACATATPSPELVEARRVYEKAEKSPAAELAPAEMLQARTMMNRAEQEFQEDPGSDKEKQLAYLTNRRSKIAMAHGERLDAERDARHAKDTYVQTQSNIIDQTRAANSALREQQESYRRALNDTESELAEINQKLKTKESLMGAQVEELEARAKALRDKKTDLEASLAAKDQALASEREARLAAEARATDALKSLEKIAQVKADQKETVITLSGSVVFKTGTATLLPIAQDKLTDVATALKAQDKDVRIVVEGHTDSRGSDSLNQKLSRDRAQAVRNFLVSRDVNPKYITAVGRGESEPVANNNTAEGRANNRRVEIVLRDS